MGLDLPLTPKNQKDESKLIEIIIVIYYSDSHVKNRFSSKL